MSIRKIFLFSSCAFPGLGIGAYLFKFKDPSSGATILLSPKDSRMYAMGANKTYDVYKVNSLTDIEMITVAPNVIDDDWLFKGYYLLKVCSSNWSSMIIDMCSIKRWDLNNLLIFLYTYDRICEKD